MVPETSGVSSEALGFDEGAATSADVWGIGWKSRWSFLTDQNLMDPHSRLDPLGYSVFDAQLVEFSGWGDPVSLAFLDDQRITKL